MERIVVALWLASWVLPIVAVIAVTRGGDEEFQQIGHSRVTWIGLLVVGAVFCGPVGTGLACFYFLALRPKLVANAHARPGAVGGSDGPRP